MTSSAIKIAACTASAVIISDCKVISKYLVPKYLFLLKTQTEMRDKNTEFESKFGVKQAFGCIVGTHIPIHCPIIYSQDFLCYKQYFSLSVQAICDTKAILWMLSVFGHVVCMRLKCLQIQQ